GGTACHGGEEVVAEPACLAARVRSVCVPGQVVAEFRQDHQFGTRLGGGVDRAQTGEQIDRRIGARGELRGCDSTHGIVLFSLRSMPGVSLIETMFPNFLILSQCWSLVQAGNGLFTAP